jgi:hypothetical protein
MPDLTEDQTAFPVDGCGQAHESGDVLVRTDPGLEHSIAPTRVTEHVPAEGNANPASGKSGVQLDHLIGDESVWSCRRLAGAGPNNPIGSLNRADHARLQERWSPGTRCR